MMTSAELNRRNEAIALFDGNTPLPMLEHGGREIPVPPRDYRSWDALMPVVEKINRADGKNGKVEMEYGDLPSVVYSWSRGLLKVGKFKAYFWFGDLRDYRKSCCFMCSSMIEAYFMSVSDYCLSLNPHPGGPSGVEEGYGR